MSKLKPASQYAASEISEATKFSPALTHYLGFSFSQDANLRHQNRTETWNAAALGTILNTESAQAVCGEWSLVAKSLLREVFNECFKEAPVALFALGKLGSDELNLSSDVDILIVAHEEDPGHLKALRLFQKTLTERTPRGFLFRVDFDLRPGGRQGPMIPTLDHFVDYYGNYGETWERLAFVRLVSIAGNQDVISQVQAFAKKFTYRKHLDYTLLDDLKSLRSRIRQHYSPQSQAGILDLKLGVGGIRDVELFVHALQVIHGGKNPKLQVPSTTQALSLLEESKILPSNDAQFLKTHYWRLRQLENFVQAQNDEQTHLLDKSTPVPTWAETSLKTLDQDLKRCDQIVETLLGKASSTTAAPVIESTTAQEVWQEILQIEVLSRNKERDEQARLQFLSEFYETLQKQKGDSEKALQHLKEFIKSTRAKASFFTLLVRNKNLMDELAWLFGHSPYLSQILSSRPELIDSYVYRSQELTKDDLSILLEQLVEKRLLGELINGSHYLEDKNIEVLQANLSATADEIAETLLSELKKEFPSKMGILCLGKWGGQELGFRSDLDFVFVTPDEPGENDTKLARRFINRLTESRKGGSIFAIDMRLKPSGKAGPFVISENQLREYLTQEAQIWERQAYLKARVLSTNPIPVPSWILSRKLLETELQELERIRGELIRYAPDTLDLKYMDGGMLDIELFSQTEILEKSRAVSGTSTLDFLSEIPSAEPLKKNYLRLRQIEQMLQLVSTEGGAKLRSNHESFQHLAKALQVTANELEQELSSLISENLQILNQLDPRRRSKILNSN
ncbi:glutamine-synthetase adenylyltransferase [Bdellovibrio sp. HCB337]|uniref:[protein-PII] uridylyltransferase family protein n=1 Tax=Bdellovibrio sp. HCB337 TaxID=3394358 RepID=UPI0039A511D3